MPAFHHGGTVGWRSAAPGLRRGLRRRARSVVAVGIAANADSGQGGSRSRGLLLLPPWGWVGERVAGPGPGRAGGERGVLHPRRGGQCQELAAAVGSGAEPGEAGGGGGRWEGGGVLARLWREAAGCGTAAGEWGKGGGGGVPAIWGGGAGCGAIEGRRGTPGCGEGVGEGEPGV